MPEKELSRRTYKTGYYVSTTLCWGDEFGGQPETSPLKMRRAYTTDGDLYIGNPRVAYKLVVTRKLTKLQKTHQDHVVCSIGLGEKEQKWFGWSHRAIVGFGIGDKIFEEQYGDEQTPFRLHGKITIKNLDQAKEAASNFAQYVS